MLVEQAPGVDVEALLAGARKRILRRQRVVNAHNGHAQLLAPRLQVDLV